MSAPRELHGYAHRVDVRADIDAVWSALVEPESIARWYGHARVDAREGGSYELLADAQHPRVAHIDVFRPPHRLRLIYLPAADYPQGDAVIVDDFLLDRVAAITVVRLLGSGIPVGGAWDEFYLQLRAQWQEALVQLKGEFESPDAPYGDSARR